MKPKFIIINTVLDCCKKIDNFKDIKQQDYFFEIPITFNAQNDFNRCGYGNHFLGDELVHKGTLYGETTEYMFIGVRYRKFMF